MSNIFKTVQKPSNNRYTDNHYLSNSFKPKNESVVQRYEIKEEEFPGLCGNEEIEIKSKNVMQFKNAILKKNDEKIQKEEIPPGWVKIYYDKNRNIVMEKCKQDAIKFEEEEKEEDQSNATKVFQALVDKWENDRISYNKMYGEGEYEKLHFMEKREEYNYSDDDTIEEETDSIKVDNDEYDDDQQYYDLY